jgi:hypothetical protein
MLLKIARPDRALVRDNLIPSAQHWERTLPLGREILQAIRQRESIIAERGLDRAFGLPDANWSDTKDSHLRPANDFRVAVDRLATLEWDELRHLRLMAQAFSGYSMRELVPAWQVPSVGAIPVDFDDKWQKADFSAFLTRWRALVHGLPDWALNKPPHMLGEFGLRGM